MPRSQLSPRQLSTAYSGENTAGKMAIMGTPQRFFNLARSRSGKRGKPGKLFDSRCDRQSAVLRFWDGLMLKIGYLYLQPGRRPKATQT